MTSDDLTKDSLIVNNSRYELRDTWTIGNVHSWIRNAYWRDKSKPRDRGLRMLCSKRTIHIPVGRAVVGYGIVKKSFRRWVIDGENESPSHKSLFVKHWIRFLYTTLPFLKNRHRGHNNKGYDYVMQIPDNWYRAVQKRFSVTACKGETMHYVPDCGSMKSRISS